MFPNELVDPQDQMHEQESCFVHVKIRFAQNLKGNIGETAILEIKSGQDYRRRNENKHQNLF